MAKYLKPLKMFEEGLKTQYEGTIFLGLNFGNKFASMAISDECYTYALAFCNRLRDEKMLDNLVLEVQYCVKEIGLEGIIIANNYPVASPVNIHNFMDDLCKKGKFESLKYTCWKDNLTSKAIEDYCEQYRFLFRGMTFPMPLSQEDLIDASSAAHMLQTNLDFCNTLVRREIVSDAESEDYE
ncbi:hypothetical protein Ddye_007239 [Dipteronia dyeriana]|uniref:Uncharacterized protein n=1 Tax=Dipteronia dyeriana TaxID=168575 RepID=A0AAD9XJG2_9ROSI|nr:hypothetical protein Ddye_007239 [Dipteronia dyeriana]